MAVQVGASGRTHVGLVRRRNEDSLYVGESLFVVADGMGGHVAGDVASSTAIDILRPYDECVDPARLSDTLGQAIGAVNNALRQKAQAEPRVAGMGTTLVAMLRSGTAAAVANVGDSRVYLRRGGTTLQITEDHTYEHLVAEACHVPNLGEKLSRFLDGRVDGRSPDISAWDLQAGDRFLLCSDGLSSFVPHAAIHAALDSAVTTTDAAADVLIALAVESGGKDNVTVIVVDVR